MPSYSELQDIFVCPYKWHLRWKLRVPEPEPPERVHRGIVFHDAIARAIRGEAIGTAAAAALATQSGARVSWTALAVEQMVRHALAAAESAGVDFVRAEERFERVVAGTPVVGRVDAVVRIAPLGGAEGPLDWKVSERFESNDRLMYDPQLWLYAAALGYDYIAVGWVRPITETNAKWLGERDLSYWARVDYMRLPSYARDLLDQALGWYNQIRTLEPRRVPGVHCRWCPVMEPCFSGIGEIPQRNREVEDEPQ